jgi:hypothetical protein
VAIAGAAWAQSDPETNDGNIHKFMARDYAKPNGAGVKNLIDHG